MNNFRDDKIYEWKKVKYNMLAFFSEFSITDLVNIDILLSRTIEEVEATLHYVEEPIEIEWDDSPFVVIGEYYTLTKGTPLLVRTDDEFRSIEYNGKPAVFFIKDSLQFFVHLCDNGNSFFLRKSELYRLILVSNYKKGTT